MSINSLALDDRTSSLPRNLFSKSISTHSPDFLQYGHQLRLITYETKETK